MFDKDGKEALEAVNKLIKSLNTAGIIYKYGSGVRPSFLNIVSSGVEACHVKKIRELEEKLAAVMELLNISEIGEEKIGARLKKGSKEVPIKKPSTNSVADNGVRVLGGYGFDVFADARHFDAKCR